MTQSILQPPEKNIATTRSTQIMLGYGKLKYKNNNTTDMTLEKLPPYGN